MPALPRARLIWNSSISKQAPKEAAATGVERIEKVLSQKAKEPKTQI